MIVKGVAASLPERRVTNDDIIALVREHSTDYDGDLERALRIIHRLLGRTGLRERRWCGRHESPLDHVAVAVREALRLCYFQPRHIELLVYVGVARGFLEPSNAHMIASALGFGHADCFDVVEACQSWVRALDMVNSHFKAGRYANALVVNAEFNTIESGIHHPHFLQLKNDASIPYSFPSLTIGDAATATVLTAKDPDNFGFRFTSRPDLGALCTIPIPGYEAFCHPEPEIGLNGTLAFTSFGEALHRHLSTELPLVFNAAKQARDVDVLFVHASSAREWQGYAEAVRMGDKVFHIYPDCGNVVSASIPTAMDAALRAGRLKRGMKVGAWVGSAGMSYSYTKFDY